MTLRGPAAPTRPGGVAGTRGSQGPDWDAEAASGASAEGLRLGTQRKLRGFISEAEAPVLNTDNKPNTPVRRETDKGMLSSKPRTECSDGTELN